MLIVLEVQVRSHLVGDAVLRFVVGPDEEFGETLCAYVEPADPSLTAAQVRTYLLQHLAKYKVPRVIEFSHDLPREDSGKIFKRKLREPFWKDTGRQI